MEFSLATDRGGYDLQGHVRRIGEDLLVAIWGGSRPHIGAVAVAQPRPSLRDPGARSATASVFCYVGHKEDDLAKDAAQRLAARFNVRVVVAAGVHWDDLSAEGIQTVLENARLLVERMAERIQAEAAGPDPGGQG